MLYTFLGVSTFYELYVGLLKASIAAAVAASVLISLDRLIRVAKYLKIVVRTWLSGVRPEDAFSARPLPDLVRGSGAYPRVAVQLPMFNERSVCQQCIASSCELIWPRDRFCVQVGGAGSPARPAVAELCRPSRQVLILCSPRRQHLLQCFWEGLSCFTIVLWPVVVALQLTTDMVRSGKQADLCQLLKDRSASRSRSVCVHLGASSRLPPPFGCNRGRRAL